MKKSEQVITHIERIGSTELPSTSIKFRKFTHPADTWFYFVGKNGSLRAGQSLADSMSLTASVTRLIKERQLRDDFAKEESI